MQAQSPGSRFCCCRIPLLELNGMPRRGGIALSHGGGVVAAHAAAHSRQREAPVIIRRAEEVQTYKGLLVRQRAAVFSPYIAQSSAVAACVRATYMRQVQAVSCRMVFRGAVVPGETGQQSGGRAAASDVTKWRTPHGANKQAVANLCAVSLCENCRGLLPQDVRRNGSNKLELVDGPPVQLGRRYFADIVTIAGAHS